MIKIERISPDALVKVDGNTVTVGYTFHGTLLKTLEVKNGEVQYSINERTLEYKFSPGMGGTSNPIAIAKAAASKELKTATAAVLEMAEAVAAAKENAKEAEETKVDAVEDVAIEEGFSAPKAPVKPVVGKVNPRKAILGK